METPQRVGIRGLADRSAGRRLQSWATPIGCNPDRNGGTRLTASGKKAETPPKEGEGEPRSISETTPAVRSQVKRRARLDMSKKTKGGTRTGCREKIPGVWEGGLAQPHRKRRRTKQ